MKVDNALFEKILSVKGITKKAFSQYAKIPYYTVAGWKKVGTVPAYVMVIAKDMAYRKMLDENAKNQMNRSHKRETDLAIDLTLKEQKHIEAVFWGTNYTISDIIENLREGNEKFIKQFEENLPKKLKEKVYILIKEEDYA
jgi:hypothetical protein